MNAYWKIGLVLALLLAGFGIGWAANGWRLNAKLEANEAEQATALAAANARTLTAQQALDAARDAQAQALAKVDADGTLKLKALSDENTTLRASIASGARRVLVHAACPAVGAAGVPQTPAGSSVDSGAGAELTADARQGYLDFRAGYGKQVEQLAACQAAVRTLTGQP